MLFLDESLQFAVNVYDVIKKRNCILEPNYYINYLTSVRQDW